MSIHDEEFNKVINDLGLVLGDDTEHRAIFELAYILGQNNSNYDTVLLKHLRTQTKQILKIGHP